MASPRHLVFLVAFCQTWSLLPAQENGASIDQTRQLQQLPPAISPRVTADGMALPEDEESDDESFGKQLILKRQQPAERVEIRAEGSLVYTNNAALTRAGALEDFFAIAGATVSFRPRLSHDIHASVGARASTFRYFEHTELDFHNLGAAAGATWTPRSWPGFALFGGYDFTELFDDENELLSEHRFTAGVQKTFTLGRSHALAAAALAGTGVADPGSAERSQLGGFATYELHLTRHATADLGYASVISSTMKAVAAIITTPFGSGCVCAWPPGLKRLEGYSSASTVRTTTSSSTTC